MSPLCPAPRPGWKPCTLPGKILLLTVGALALGVAPALPESHAQTPGWTVSGRVLEKGTRRPLPGALVAVREIESVSAVSDAEGRFDLTFPGPGLYTLTAAAPG